MTENVVDMKAANPIYRAPIGRSLPVLAMRFMKFLILPGDFTLICVEEDPFLSTAEYPN
jgi:hypothetical protein